MGRVLVEEGLAIARELYVGMLVDRSTKKIVLMASADGGRGEAATETWAVRVAPLNEWPDVSRRQLAAVREALRR